MSKLLKRIQLQRKAEGDTQNIKDVLRIYNLLLELDNQRIWESKWSVLIDTKFVGVYPNSKRCYYPSRLYYALTGNNVNQGEEIRGIINEIRTTR